MMGTGRYYITVKDEKVFWNALQELIAEGCKFEIWADPENRVNKFVSATFWVRSNTCKASGVIQKHTAPTYEKLDKGRKLAEQQRAKELYHFYVNDLISPIPLCDPKE